MKDSRIGESLWFIWDNDDFVASSSYAILFYTEGTVDLEHEVVRRALASSIQREGIALSLSQGFMMIDRGEIIHGFVGTSEEFGDQQLMCDENGITPDGMPLSDIVPATWVEVYDF